jgi:hypothetical protein
MLSDDDALWGQASGGHRGAEWASDDLAAAAALYDALSGNAKAIIDLMIDRPGERLSADWIIAQIGDGHAAQPASAGRHAVAGSLSQLSAPQRNSGRRLPFYWWAGSDSEASLYAMKPSVARLFRAARESAGISARETAADTPVRMLSIASGMQQILDVAADYTPRPTPAMRARAQVASDLAAALSRSLQEAPDRSFAVLGLTAKAGGQQGSVSAVPWVRIYSPTYAPTALEGIYLAYLFAADGSRVYLALMQGTSEFRSDQMRPITDRRVLHSRTAVARSVLGELLESDGAAGATASIDLAWQGRAYPYRIRAYEDASILAREYQSGQIPADERLLSDLFQMLPLLARLYGDETVHAPADPESGGVIDQDGDDRGDSSTQGRTMDPDLRRKIELRAEDHAVEYFTEQGWTVRRVGHLKLGYDLECTNAAGGRLHVEVKGTRTLGDRILLTANEVLHVRQAGQCGAEHALYVLSQIQVESESPIRCTGGESNPIQPWTINDQDLLATQYSLAIPQRIRQSDSG